MGDPLNLKHPLIPGDRGLYDLILNILGITVALVAAATELSEILDVVVALVAPLVDHISDVSIPIHVVAHFIIAIIIPATCIVLDHGLLEPEFVLDAHLTQLKQERAHAVAMPGLELARWHVQLDAHLFQF